MCITVIFTLTLLQIISGMGYMTQHFILHEGPERPCRDLILAAGLLGEELNEEIWIFNNGYWSKDAGMWQEIQTANWDDVILEDG